MNLTSGLSYVSIAVLIFSIISVGQSSGSSGNDVFNAVSALSNKESSSIDEVAAANLAAKVAQTTDISVQANVTSRSTSLEARAELGQSSQEFATKPLMLSDALKDLVASYKVQKGDSLASIAAEHSVSKRTVKWANNIEGDTVAVGQKLRIPTVDGIIYTVKEGETAASLAKKYQANKERIISFNNAELSGLKAGQQIVIPGGVLPEDERPGYEEPASTTTYNSYASSNTSTGSVANTHVPSYSVGYPFGWCTYYAAGQAGAPGSWGNANTWDDYAAATPGWTVSSTPVVGAIAQRDTGWAGHVGIVEAVSADGTKIKYSDMNGKAGWGNVYHSGWVPASSYAGSYIYRN